MYKCCIVTLIPWLVSGLAFATESGLSRCRAIADAATRLSCYDSFDVSSIAVVKPPETIDSHIPGVFEGWQPRAQISLANGQVWQVTEDSWGSYRLTDPKVTLRRGVSGSFFLELTGENRSIKVKRIQ
jgi:hypothetical protein